MWPLVFVISRAWLLEWDCDLKCMVPWISPSLPIVVCFLLGFLVGTATCVCVCLAIHVFLIEKLIVSFHDLAFFTFACVSEQFLRDESVCFYRVCSPFDTAHRFPSDTFRTPRTVLDCVHRIFSLDTEYCFCLYLGLNEGYGGV